MTLLITPAEVTNLTPASDNIAANQQLPSAIFQAQLQYVRPVLGRKLYDALMADVEAGTQTPRFVALQVELRPYLAYASVQQFLPFLHYKATEKGVQTFDGTNQTPQADGLQMLMDKIANDINTLKADLHKWLIDNAKDYPEFDCPPPIDTTIISFV